jgi:hypothetical protein
MSPILAAIGWPVLDRIRFGSSFALSPHGLFIAIGFMTGAWLLGKIGPRRGISVEEVNAIAFWSLIGAIVGARLFYVIAHYSEFGSFVDMLKVWNGGISLLGGIAGATLVNVPRVRHRGYTFFQVADAIAPCLALGIAIGRIGDLIIGDHLGKPTSWFLAWQYKGGTLAPPFTCLNGTCQAGLQGNHLEVITRTDRHAQELDGSPAGTGRGRPSDRAVRHDPGLDPVRPAVALAEAHAARRHPYPHVRPVVRTRAHPGGLAAHRQAVLGIHGIAVDGVRGVPDLGVAPDLVGVPSEARSRGTSGTRGIGGARGTIRGP